MQLCSVMTVEKFHVEDLMSLKVLYYLAQSIHPTISYSNEKSVFDCLYNYNVLLHL